MALALLLLPGCGVAGHQEATGIADDDVPYGLLDPDAIAVVPQPTGQVVELCLLRGDLLVRVPRGSRRRI